MIHTKAYKADESRLLMEACRELKKLARNNLDDLFERRQKWLPWLPRIFISFAITFALIGSVPAILLASVLPTYTDVFPQISIVSYVLTILLWSILPSVVIVISMEFDALASGEVNPDFYAKFADKAKRFPDLALAVDGQDRLTVREAETTLNRLIQRLEKEISLPSPQNSLDEMREAFQKISMADKSML
jgi:hypothetical protein